VWCWLWTRVVTMVVTPVICWLSHWPSRLVGCPLSPLRPLQSGEEVALPCPVGPVGQQEEQELWPVSRPPAVCSATPGETLMRGSLSSPLFLLSIIWASCGVWNRNVSCRCVSGAVLYCMLANRRIDGIVWYGKPWSRLLTSSSIDLRAVQKLWSHQ
jgi:hypothetical protein